MDTLGLIECRSIAAGSACLDTMLKASEVTLLSAGSICPGKYIIYITGDRASVQTSITKARESGINLADSAIISNISKEIIHVLSRKPLEKLEHVNALGVIETQTLTSSIEMADLILKSIDIKLVRLTLAQCIAGKAYFVLSGDLASVQESVTLTKNTLSNKLVDAVAIARPEPAVIKTLLGGVK